MKPGLRKRSWSPAARIAAVLLTTGACTRTALVNRGEVGSPTEASHEAAAEPRDAPEFSHDAPPDVASDPAPDRSDTVAESARPDAAVSEDAQAELTLSHVLVWANCMPTNIPAFDHVLVYWKVEVKGARGRNFATLTDAWLTVFDEWPDASESLTQHFWVDIPSFALVNGAGRAEQRKASADVPLSRACNYYCHHYGWSLDLTFDVGKFSASGEFECAM